MPREWPGIQRDTAGVGAGANDAVNVDFYTKGELRRRPGLAGSMPAGGPLLAEFTDPAFGVRVVHVDAAGDIVLTEPGTQNAETVATGYNIDQVPRWARSNNRLYITNDFDPMVAIYGSETLHFAGIAGPAAAMGEPAYGDPASPGPDSGGPYLARYRYFNSKSLYFSTPSPTVSFSIPDTTTRTLTFDIGTEGTDIIRSDDLKVDQIIVQMTVAGGTEFYDVAFVNQTEAEVVIELSSAAILLQSFTGANAGGDALPPPLCLYITEHRKRLFGIGSSVRTIDVAAVNENDELTVADGSEMWAGRLIRVNGDEYRIVSSTTTKITLSTPFDGTTGTYTAQIYSRAPDMLYWSDAGYPEHWRPAVNARRVFADDSDSPTGLISFYGALYIFSLTKVALLSFKTAPEVGELEVLPTDMGCWNQACVVIADNRFYGFGPAGVWTVVATQPSHISKPIDDLWRGDVDATKSDKFHGVYDPRRRVVYWFYVRSGQTEPDTAIALDVDGNRWFRVTYDTAKESADVVRAADGVPRMCLGGAGRSWFVTEGVFDGVAPAAAIQTVDAAATTGIIPVTGSLPANLDGVTVYLPSTGESAVIASNTSSAITLDSALSAAPPAGTVLHLGRIPVVWDEKGNEQTEAKVRASQVQVTFIPSPGEIEVRAYRDFQTSPLAFTRSAVDVLPNGVTLSHGSGVARINTADSDGWVPLPGFANYARTWRLRVEAAEPQGDLRLLNVQVTPEKADVGKVRRE